MLKSFAYHSGLAPLGLLRCILLVLIALSAWSTSSSAHDFANFSAPYNDPDKLSQFLKKHPDSAKSLRPDRIFLLGLNFMEWVIDGSRGSEITWKNGTKLTVCFYSDTPKVNSKVMTIAREWSKYGNIEFDAGDLNSPHLCKNQLAQIRIAYDYPGGSWSEVGTMNRNVPLNGPTMNLARFHDDPPDEQRFSWIVLHEFGHVLGFGHEFRNPAGLCEDEFDWVQLQSEFRGEAGKFKMYPNTDAFPHSAFDKLSVMRYYFNPRVFKKAEQSSCFGPEVSELSAGDREGISKIYPLPGSSR